jgi:pentatricopeptide repeat protein
MDLYAKCGELRNSGQLLGEISSGSCITWKATSQSGFIQDGSYVEAIELFRQMLDSGLKPGAEILGSPLESGCMYASGCTTNWVKESLSP